MPIRNLPGMASVRELQFIGRGVLADVLELADLRTVSDIRAANLDDVSDNGPLKRVWRAIHALSSSTPTSSVKNWRRVGLAAYHAILRVQDAQTSDLIIPHEFTCPISHDWMADPVITVPSGITYDRVNLHRWLDADPQHRDPISGEVVTSVVANRALREAIERYRPLEQRFTIM